MKKHLGLLLRVGVSAGLLALAFHWVPLWDAARLADGATLTGRATALPDGTVRFQTRDGRTRLLSETDLAGGIEKGLSAGIVPLFATLRWRHVPVPFAVLGTLFLVGAWRWKMLLAALGYRITLRSAFELTLIAQFLSTFLPGTTSGDLFKAVFVARNRSDKTKPVLTVFVDRLMGIGGLVILACVAVAFKMDDPAFRGPAQAILAIALLGTGTAAFVLSRRVRRLLRWDRIAPRLPFGGVLASVEQALVAFRNAVPTLLAGLALSVGIHLTIVLAHWGYGQALAFERAGPADFFVLIPIANSIKAVPISIGSLGVAEVSYQKLFGVVGEPAARAMALSLLIFATYFLWSLLGGIFLLLARHKVDLSAIDAQAESAERA